MSAADEIDAELERRRERVAVAERAAAQLREIFAEHPKQAAFFRRNPGARKRATTKTRRAGATVGGVREFLARAIEQPGWRGTYVTTTSDEAHDRAWSNDAGNGFAQVLRRLGTRTRTGANGQRTTVETVELGGVTIELRVGDLTLVFSNGSEIDLYGVNTLSRIDIKRGNAKHAFWVDEAQGFPNLAVFFKEVVTASIAETLGEVWLTGTPGRDPAGFFYDVTGGATIPGWEVHVLAAVDNPFFGRVVWEAGIGWGVVDNLDVRHGPYPTQEAADEAAVAIRWENAAGREIRENQWSEEDPHVQREFFGKWVHADARYVYPVHAVPAHVLVYAPQRLAPNPIRPQDPPWIDLQAALADLPVNRRAARGYQWMTGLGVDFGYWPDPFALVAVAFNYELADVFELFSWKAVKVDTDAQGVYMRWLFDALPNLVSFVGDTAGKEKIERWEERMNLTFDVAQKADKNALEDFLANDIRLGRYHFRGRRDGDPTSTDSPLLTEMRHLVYLPAKPGKTREVDKFRAVAGVVHGDHCCDGARYLHIDMMPHLARAKPVPPTDPIERGKIEAERFERRIDKQEERARARADETIEADDPRWGLVENTGDYGDADGYE